MQHIPQISQVHVHRPSPVFDIARNGVIPIGERNRSPQAAHGAQRQRIPKPARAAQPGVRR